VKRYIWTNFFIDTIKNFYFQASADIQAQERENMKGLLIPAHGANRIDEKVDRYFSFKPPDFVIETEFHPMLREVQDAYVSSYYYPSLTGACCIAERILNLLMLRLRDYHKSSRWYKKIYNKNSFDNWDLCIKVLRDWGILSAGLSDTFDELKEIRHQSIHFQDLPDLEARSINALKEVMKVTDSLFGMRADVLFMHGHFFIKKEKEADPLVREFYIPRSHYVGYRYRIENRNGQATIVDNDVYEDQEVTDEEFVQLLKTVPHS
jgi:hypothetical protein